MGVICLHDAAFHALIEEVINRLKQENNWTTDKWISDGEAMHLLNIKSKTTLQKLRDEGKIRFSQPQKKVILYDRDSINIYLENNARETFLTMQEEQEYQADYQKGFNEGYMLAKHLPALSDSLAQIESPSSRIEGFKDGRKQFALEQTKEHRPSWMKSDRLRDAQTDPSKNKDDKEKEG